MPDRRSFWSELKRRNVLRAVALYVGVVWALSQGISQLSPALGLPDYATRWFLIACGVGLPFWAVFGWLYEFTPHGFRRESEIGDAPAVHHSNARRLDIGIIAVLALAVVLLASGYFLHRPLPVTTMAESAVPFHPPHDSLVVLPFANLSGDPRQQYFSDGITEELTDALGQNPGLRVIAWETAARFRNQGSEPAVVGKQLNVASILNGSVQREGSLLRITAELVDTRTGVQLWSAHYDRSFADIFKVQDQVSAAIAAALKVKFAQADLPARGTRNPDAHDLVLKGRALKEQPNAARLAAASHDFEAAIALDPDYAEAHALLSRTLLQLTARSTLPLRSTLPQIRAEAEKALALDPRNADAWTALGDAAASADPPDHAEARVDLQRAITLDPSNAGAHLDAAMVLPLRAALAEDREATRLDPAKATAWNNLAVQAQDSRDWTLEIQATERLLKLDPGDVDCAFFLAFGHQQLHQYEPMVAAFDRVHPSTAVDRQQVAAGRLTYQAVRDRTLRAHALAALAELSRERANTDVASNLMQLYLALDETAPALALLQGLCPAYPFYCDDLAVNPVYQSLHGNPRFDALAKAYTTVTAR